MSRTISYQIKEVEDYCLRDNRWLALDWRLKLNDLSVLEEELQQAIAIVKKNSLYKIEILLPVEIGEFANFLLKQNFKKCLSELKFDLDNFTKSKFMIQNLNFSDQLSKQKHLKKILIEQANFHYQNLPDYYLSSSEINWFFYLKQIAADANKANGLIMLIQEPKFFSALILGEYLEKTAFIWEMIVCQEKRHFHLGTFLLNQYLAKLQILGVNRVYVETISHSYAKEWYQHQGFIDVSQSWFCRLK